MATDQTYTDYETVIQADWLNNVNNHVNSKDTYEHAASKISNTSTGSVPAGDVQGALTNLDGRVTTANNTANTANTTANNAMPKAGGNFTGPANANKGADLASAATVNIGAATGEYVVITGTTTITAFDTVQAGTERTVRFSDALTLTHNATTLILPTSANITTAAGDTATFRSEGSGNWRCTSYTKSDGAALLGGRMVLSAAIATTSGNSIDFINLPLWVKRITVMINGVSMSGANSPLIQLGTWTEPTTTGYVSGAGSYTSGPAVAATAATSGFNLRSTANSSAADVHYGTVTINKVTGNTWLSSWVGYMSNNTTCETGAGVVTLPWTMERVRVTSVGGTDTFDAGSVTILYEGY